jgi:hypothetical protein
MSNSWMNLVVNGLEAFQAVSKDGELTLMGTQVAAQLAKELETQVKPDDTCVLAFPSTAVLPSQTATCLVVILENRLLVSWFAGIVRKKSGTVRVIRSKITDVTWGSGTTPQTRQAAMMTVRHEGLATQFALPRARTKVVASAVKSALLTGTVETPADPKPELGPSGRPRHIEEGIERWFAYRRGEATMGSVGLRPVELLRWMTDEEKELDQELVRAKKAR